MILINTINLINDINNTDKYLEKSNNLANKMISLYKKRIFSTLPIYRYYIKGTIIIVSLYMGNNLTQEQINISLNSITNLRKYYPYEVIVIVDNNSPNRDWVKIANDLNMHIITNTSELYRFEIGAYNLALKYFKADKYICIQHNILFKSRIREELEIDKPDVYYFSSVLGLYMDQEGLNLLNSYLNYLNMSNWNYEPIAMWNSFYCNDLMMEKIINSGLLDLKSNTKLISQAYERILGVFFYKMLNNVKIIKENTFEKIFMEQY